ncbi:MULTISPECIES: APC family permease [Parvularcula]|uniref:Amino acid transporter n=1 Tax=Parvularcula dongshanensis TaxID=1173995 RepID=A0A840I7D4_9PROT|nr:MULTISPECIES: APC family permease [Parvularcula]MBB4660235.1 amino acid transporter [Parvularcula dongshanensis]
MKTDYEEGSLSLWGTIAMGTGVMIGAGIFVLTGQVAELAGDLFPLAFLLAAVISGFSAYSYVKMSNAFPSAGGIAAYLKKAYGEGTMTGACALLMAFSMIINESLVARTFGTYALRPFGAEENGLFVALLAVGLIGFAYVVNAAGNKWIGGVSQVAAIIKIGGIVVFGLVAMWAAGFEFVPYDDGIANDTDAFGFVAGTALAILAYKGFTTITNSGGEVKDPTKNVGRAIVWSLATCLAVYLIVAFGVAASLTVPEIVEAKNYALAEASRPAVGQWGEWFTVAVALIATASGLLASVFAVSRMLTMLTEMKLIPHRHFHLPGDLQHHLLIYTVVAAGLLAVFFDLTRIASLGAIFYLIMDMAIHWGVLRHLREEVDAKAWIVTSALVLDGLVLAAFTTVKLQSDWVVVAVAYGGVAATFALERWFLARSEPHEEAKSHAEEHG